MKLWTLSTLWIVSLLIFSGCGGVSPAPKKSPIDETLPIVTLTKNGTIVGMKTIAFEWDSVNDPRVKGIYIYRSSKQDKTQGELAYLDKINNRFKTHYLDSDISPDTKYIYSFKVFSEKAEGVPSKNITITSLPVLQSVSWIHSITGMPRTAKIIWRPHVNEKVKAYIIERKTLQDDKWEEIDTINGRLNAEFIDEELKDKYVYMYRIKVLTYDDIISTPSQIVKVVTKALPLSIQNIKTTKKLPKKIKVDWDASTQEDFLLYYLYKSDEVDGSYKLIATLHNNTFLDKIDEDGKTYYYRVSAVDKDGLESKHEKNSVSGMSLVKPLAPSIIEAKLVGSQIEIHWSKTDPRSVSYIVRKKHKQGWFDEKIEDFKGIRDNKFIDTSIVPGSTFSYIVYSVDKNKIVSEKSVEVKIVTPESNKLIRAKQIEPKAEVSTVFIKDEVENTVSPIQDLDLSGL